MTSRLAIWEPAAQGHHLFYVKLLADWALRRGLDPTWLHTGEAARSQDAENHLGKMLRSGGLGQQQLPAGLRPSQIVEAAHELGTEVLVLPDGDVLLTGLVGVRIPKALIVRILITRDPRLELRGPLRRRGRMLGKAALCAQLHGHKKQVELSLLESPYGPVHKVPLRNLNLGRPVADPVVLETSEHLVREFQRSHLDDQRVWLAIAGHLDPRKGIERVFSALRLLPLDQYGVVLAGTCSADFEQELVRLQEPLKQGGLKVVRIPHPLLNEEMSTIISAVDCVPILYSTPNPPSTFGKALAAGTFALLSGPPILRSYAANFPSNATQCEPSDQIISQVFRGLTHGNRCKPVCFPNPDLFASTVLHSL